MDAIQLANENILELWPTTAKIGCSWPFKNVNKTLIMLHFEAKRPPNQFNAIATGPQRFLTETSELSLATKTTFLAAPEDARALRRPGGA